MSPAIEGIRNEPDKANIVLIITDQQRYDTIAALGYPHAVTPNLDRLVREGTHFESCYITAPSCVHHVPVSSRVFILIAMA
jgi:arylsulfatase A-like enzyme